MKDQALEALEKNKDDRSEIEIDLLHEFLQEWDVYFLISL